MSLQSGFYVNEQRALVQNEARGAEGNVKAARLTEKKKKKKTSDRTKNESWRAFKEDDT